VTSETLTSSDPPSEGRAFFAAITGERGTSKCSCEEEEEQEEKEQEEEEEKSSRRKRRRV